MVKWLKIPKKDKIDHNMRRVRPGSYIIGINGDTILLRKPLSEVKRIVSKEPRPLILTMRNYHVRDADRRLHLLYILFLKFYERKQYARKMRSFMMLKFYSGR